MWCNAGVSPIQSLMIIALPLTGLAACGRPATDPAAGGLTVGESQKLDDAARRLEARAPSPGAENAQHLEADVRAKIAAEPHADGR